MIIQIRCKNSCRKIGVFFRPYFAKTSCFHHDLRWHKKKTTKICMTGLTKKSNLILFMFVILLTFFWNNNKRNMERKKFANMNREKAYTRNTYVAHYTQMQHLCIQSYNKCICTDDNFTIWVYTLIKLFCHLNWLAITKYIKYGW